MKVLWESLNQNKGHVNQNRTSCLLSDVEKVNAFFASYSYDPAYNAETVSAYRPSTLIVKDFQPLQAYKVIGADSTGATGTFAPVVVNLLGREYMAQSRGICYTLK